ncbi:hypothetical protein H0H93_005366 [Arthromyces matolae]|nr:hypothetical protein H0H93_005366 [Arthromyces matolae]
MTGFGTRMKDTHMVIMWPNEDGSTTLSQRMGIGHVEPLPVEYPPRHAIIAEPRVSAVWHPKAVKTLAFTMPVNKTVLSWTEATEHLIWAYGKIRPEKPHYSELIQHFVAGYLTLDLGGKMPEYVIPSVESAAHGDVKNSEATLDAIESVSAHKGHASIIIAHGVLCSLGFLVLLPAGALFARWGRSMTPRWLGIHRMINSTVAFPFITLGWILGPVVVFNHQGKELLDDVHQLTGLLLVIMYYFQVALGRWVHHRREKNALTAKLHPPVNIVHVLLGLSLIAVAFAQVRSGMKEAKMWMGDTHISHWCHVLWNVWVLLLPVAYLTGTVLLPRQLFQERLGLPPDASDTYIKLSFPSGHRSAFEMANDSEDAFDKILRGRVPIEITKGESESSRPLLRDQRT